MKKYSFLIICTLLTGLLFTTCEPWIVPEAVFVNFNANGGQGDMKAQRFEDGEKQNLELNSFTRKYYNFAGWNTRADGKGLTYRNGQIVSLNKSCILYAQWERITYSLTFNANGGKGTMDPQTFEEGVSQAIAANTFTRDGYNFAGWNTKADGSGTSYANKYYISLKQDMTLYAQWERKGFILTFNANGGTGTMAAQTFEVGVARTITANSFTRSGYTFTGWNTKADGSGTAYTDKQSITLTQDITLYAQWELFTPTYVDLGLSVKWANCNVGATFPEDYGDYFAWGETSPKDDYSWSTYKYCNGSSSTLTKYNTNSSNGTVDNKTTLELSDDAARVNWGGNWRIPTRTEQDELRNNCTWTWITQNGVDGYKVTSKTNGNSIFLPAAGYRSGTSVYDVGSDGDYWSSSLYESSPGFACYLCFSSGNVADWFYNLRREGRPVRAVCGNNTAAQTFTLTFNANGGSGTMAAQTFEAGVSQALAANAFTRSGYTFTGWNTAANGSGTSYTDKQSITLSQNITLYAQWKKDIVNYTVTFNANGGTGTMAAQTFVAGVSQTIAANTFTRSGYTFTGWNTNADGSGTSYTDKQSITISQDITLYAQWYQEQVVSGTENGHDYVDLGLPTGLKWATCNVGATTPEAYGDYFAWGETSPKSNYTWETYKFRTSGDSYANVKFNKYNTSSDYGTVDNKTTLELTDDAARVNWGGKWRMPTSAEQDELRNNCTWTWTTQNGVNGYKVISKTNGNSIFLPAAGEWEGASFYRSQGYYRSSSLLKGNSSGACGLRFAQSFVERFDFHRHNGRPVRAVCGETEQVVSGTENGHDYVDLGLPSGLKWATCNVGATTSDGYGDYFAWGETSPKDNYDWSTYKYCNGSYDTMTKYCTNSRYGYNGFTDNKTTLELSDDAARANWGGKWRMPTTAEQDELRNNCTWTWTQKNGIKGYKVTSKTNGNSIFLPAAGDRDGTSVYNVGSSGYYWSSSLYDESRPNCAYDLAFSSGNVDWYDYYSRYHGHTVRAVCP